MGHKNDSVGNTQLEVRIQPMRSVRWVCIFIPDTQVDHHPSQVRTPAQWPARPGEASGDQATQLEDG